MSVKPKGLLEHIRRHYDYTFLLVIYLHVHMCLFVLLISNTIRILISFILFHSTYKNQIKEVFSFILNACHCFQNF